MSNLANHGRQFPVIAVQQFDYTDLVNGSAAALKVALPAGAIVVGGGVLVETAFDPTGTSAAATVDLGLDGIDADILADGLSLASTGFKAITGVYTPDYTGAGVTLTLAVVSDTAISAGAGKLFVEYVVVDKTHEVQVA